MKWTIFKDKSSIQSRFNNHIDFPDYTSEELFMISEKFVESEGFTIEDDLKDELIEEFTRKQIPGKMILEMDAWQEILLRKL